MSDPAPPTAGWGWRRPRGPAMIRATFGKGIIAENPVSHTHNRPPVISCCPGGGLMPGRRSPGTRARARYSTPVCIHRHPSMAVPAIAPAGSPRRRPPHADRPSTADLPGLRRVVGRGIHQRYELAQWPAWGHGGHVGGPR